MKITVEELIRLEEQDIRELRREDLDNAGDIVIDRSVPAERRMMEFLEETLEDKMIQLAKRMTRIPL